MIYAGSISNSSASKDFAWYFGFPAKSKRD